ncbi:MAG: T9SS type A sorting domain-containing protein [Ignavibacteria bacterium]|jgi:tetratricopeptide (TPR) repeat protein
MFLGHESWLPCNNSIYNFSQYLAWALDDGEIEAENVWWGSSSPSSTWFSTNYDGILDYSDWLTSDPGYGSPLAKSTMLTDTDPVIDSNDPSSLYDAGKYYSMIEEYDKASELFKKIINDYSKSKYAKKSLVSLFHISQKNKTSNSNIKTYFNNFQNQKARPEELCKKVIVLKTYQALRDRDTSLAIRLSQQMIEEYKDSEAELYGLYVLAVHNETGDSKTALAKLVEKYPNNDLTLFAQEKVNGYADWSKLEGFSLKKENSQTENEIAQDYLLNNYPNPFNPTTMIKFSIAEAGNVTLKVYNALGEEIKTLVNETLQPGVYERVFDAIELTSGVYIYKLTAGKFQKVKKMLLVK